MKNSEVLKRGSGIHGFLYLLIGDSVQPGTSIHLDISTDTTHQLASAASQVIWSYFAQYALAPFKIANRVYDLMETAERRILPRWKILNFERRGVAGLCWWCRGRLRFLGRKSVWRMVLREEVAKV